MPFLDNLCLVNDVYFISEIIKEINPNFKLFYNTKKNIYEVHNLKEEKSFVISYPFYPDYRLIEKIYKTRKENMKKLFSEIDEYNKKIETEKNNNLIDKAKMQFEQIMNYLVSNPGKTLYRDQLKNILEKED